MGAIYEISNMIYLNSFGTMYQVYNTSTVYNEHRWIVWCLTRTYASYLQHILTNLFHCLFSTSSKQFKASIWAVLKNINSKLIFHAMDVWMPLNDHWIKHMALNWRMSTQIWKLNWSRLPSLVMVNHIPMIRFMMLYQKLAKQWRSWIRLLSWNIWPNTTYLKFFLWTKFVSIYLTMEHDDDKIKHWFYIYMYQK